MFLIQKLYVFFKPILFWMEPETAHHWVLKVLKWARYLGLTRLRTSPKQESVCLMGLKFPGRVGLAAGLDKNADYIAAFAALDFAFIEVGTVTPRPQPGHIKPRLFRLIEQEALINRMGFNNRGVAYLTKRLQKLSARTIPLGVNIGKNFDTPLENAVDDYIFCYRMVQPYADYVTINISSPNTQGLRSLHQAEHLGALLSALKEEQKQFHAARKKYVPLVLKISPDLSDEDLIQVANFLLDFEMDGVIATNTTLSRPGDWDEIVFPGGLSGAPLFDRSSAVVKCLYALLKGRVPIIAVGGIDNAEKALKMKEAGAELVQIYTGLIYKGPALITQLSRALSQ